jgi:hypothetical protein
LSGRRSAGHSDRSADGFGTIDAFTLGMTLAKAAVVSFAAFVVGCNSCPTVPEINYDRSVAGQLTYQLPSAGPTSTELGPSSSFDVKPDSSGAYPGETTFTFLPDDPSRVMLRAVFVVRLAPGGASEIDLTDDNASLTMYVPGEPPPIAYHGVSGHLTLSGIDATCKFSCPLRVRGTVTVSATGPNDEVFAVTSGTFVANDTVHDKELCQG